MNSSNCETHISSSKVAKLTNLEPLNSTIKRKRKYIIVTIPRKRQHYQPELSPLNKYNQLHVNRLNQSSASVPFQSSASEPNQSSSNVPKQSSITELDQSSTELDQTATEFDQTATEFDQTATEFDQSVTEFDQSATELNQSSAAEFNQSSEAELYYPSVTEIYQPSATELYQPSTPELYQPSTPELYQPSENKIFQPSANEIYQPSTIELYLSSASQPNQSSASHLSQSSTSEANQSSINQSNQSSKSQPKPLPASQPKQSSANKSNSKYIKKKRSQGPGFIITTKKCCIEGCLSNYSSPEEIFMSPLPRDEIIRKAWLGALPVDIPEEEQDQAYVCILHFSETDIIRNDRYILNGVLKFTPRKMPRLKMSAIPKIFPTPWSSTHEEHPEGEKKSSDPILHELVRHVNINNRDDVINYFNQLPEHERHQWCLMSDSDKVVLCFMSINGICPSLLGSIVIRNSMNFQLFCGTHKVAQNYIPCQLTKIVSSQNIDTLMNFVAIM